jgi:nitrate reductase (cytochrome), electron transfer subunit
MQDFMRERRVLSLLAAAVLTMALIGLVTGTRAPEPPHPPRGPESTSSGQQAKSYQERREGRPGASPDLYEGAFAWLRSLGPAVTDPVEKTEEQRLEALSARRSRRAYAGAPPVVPHPIQEREAAACLACHSSGAVVGGIIAPMMSHESYTMCVQCHAPSREEAPEVLTRGDVGAENMFVGVLDEMRGETAWEGAPPTIPHATFMRQQCNSCHGPHGAHGLRTPHSDRASCTQCHVSAADFDQSGPPALR